MSSSGVSGAPASTFTKGGGGRGRTISAGDRRVNFSPGKHRPERRCACVRWLLVGRCGASDPLAMGRRRCCRTRLIACSRRQWGPCGATVVAEPAGSGRSRRARRRLRNTRRVAVRQRQGALRAGTVCSRRARGGVSPCGGRGSRPRGTARGTPRAVRRPRASAPQRRWGGRGRAGPAGPCRG